jgi:acylglycerol lipase
MRRLILVLAAMAALGGCAPMIQQAQRPDAGFSGPRLEADDVISFDGARLGLQRWEPAGGDPWAVIVAVHGMNDDANAFRLAAPVWARDGIATFAYEQRGFGHSPGFGVWPGPALMTEDLRTVTALVRARYPRATVAVVGESMGGSVAIEAFASGRPPAADRVVLVSPAVWGWSSQPLPNRIALWVTAHVDGSAVITPPDFITRHIRASDNIDELIHMGRDPFIKPGVRADALYGLVDIMQRAWRDVGRIAAPTVYLAGAHDQIIPKVPTLEAARRLKPVDRSAYYPNGWHLLLVDRQGATVWNDIEAFIRNPTTPLPSGAPTIPGAPTPPNAAQAAVTPQPDR